MMAALLRKLKKKKIKRRQLRKTLLKPSRNSAPLLKIHWKFHPVPVACCDHFMQSISLNLEPWLMRKNGNLSPSTWWRTNYRKNTPDASRKVQRKVSYLLLDFKRKYIITRTKDEPDFRTKIDKLLLKLYKLKESGPSSTKEDVDKEAAAVKQMRATPGMVRGQSAKAWKYGDYENGTKLNCERGKALKGCPENMETISSGCTNWITRRM